MKTATTLPPITFLRVSNGALKSETLPSRIKVLGWGRNESTKGPVVLDEASVVALQANQRALGHERVALDFEHNTLPGTPEFERTTEPRSVAAYGTVEVVPNDGLYLSALEWTPDGQRAAKNYEDLSPAVSLDKEHRVMFMHSTALTRNGAVFNTSFFSAAKPQTEVDTKMNEEQLKQIMAQLKGLEDRLAAFTAASDKATQTITALSARVDTFEQRQKAIADAAEASERSRIVALFAAEGKVPVGPDGKAYTVEALSALPVDTLRIIHANTPSTVPLSARAPRQPGQGAAGSGDLKGRARIEAAFTTQLG